MMRYICADCGAIFDKNEARYEEVCMEDYYGVGNLFPDRHYNTFMICPECGSEDVDDYYEEDEE